MNESLILEDDEAIAEIVRAARVVAVVGAKDGRDDPDAPAYGVPRSLQQRGLRIVPVNPKFQTALGEHVYPSITAVPERVDIVDVFRRPAALPAHTDEILALPESRRPGTVWMQSGIRHDEAAARLASAGIRVVMDRCLGVYAARYRARTTSPAQT